CMGTLKSFNELIIHLEDMSLRTIYTRKWVSPSPSPSPQGRGNNGQGARVRNKTKRGSIYELSLLSANVLSISAISVTK
ncbi:MAG: hypothetical protein AB1743_03795, partial [Actinomycetota bacterium]